MAFTHEGIYTCACGKTFNSSQSFNGHKTHCKEHHIMKYGNLLKFEDLNKQQQKAAELAKQAVKQKSKDFHKAKKAELQLWLASSPKCECCGKVMNERFGSGRFCSRVCANTRAHSDSTRQKIKVSLDKTWSIKQATVIPKRVCCVCHTKITNSNKTGFCQNCLRHSPEGLAKLSECRKQTYETCKANGTHKGWQSRNITSYAEKFWQQVLDNNNFTYEREFLVTCNNTHYFLDFKLVKGDKIIDLEIDGKQHTYADRAEADVIRDNNLQSLGYIIYRISWNEINSVVGNALMKSKIDDFLDFYNSL